MSAYSESKNVAINSAAGYSGVVEHSGPVHSFLEHAAIVIFPVVLLLNLYWASSHLHKLQRLWLIALAIPLGVVLGDFVSGLVHWAADTYGSEDMRVIGPSLVKPFRLHHVYPRDICTHGLVATIGNVCILAVPLLSASLYLMSRLPGSTVLAFTAVCLALMATATVATNQFHKWAHQEYPSDFARRLQGMRLVLVPRHHKRHHTAPFNVNYCITNGWLNPILNKFKFFRRLEATLGLFGIKTTNSHS